MRGEIQGLPDSTVSRTVDAVGQGAHLSRRQFLGTMAAWGLAPVLGLGANDRADGIPLRGTSYRLAPTYPLEELIGDLEHGQRGDPRRESHIPHAHWYTAETRRRFHAWGPTPRTYPPLSDLAHASLQWKRERVIATAARFLGYGYQHHHIPDWNPPAHWPWLKSCVGHNGKGVDCSNLTSFVYNQGFGIRMSSAIGRQAESRRALELHHEGISIRTIELPRDYQRRLDALHTGDLVYIRGREDGPITHVVLWVGSIGRSASDVPLVLDSHGSGVKDDDGRSIPCGVQLRPFRESSWYNRCASHAHRIFHQS